MTQQSRRVAAAYVRSAVHPGNLMNQVRCRETAATYGYKIPAELVFADVCAGRTPDRPGLNSLVAAAEDDPPFDRLYVRDHSRLSRRTLSIWRASWPGSHLLESRCGLTRREFFES